MGRSIGESGRNASLTGFWTGAYWYAGFVPSPMAGGAPFNAYLVEDGESVSGTTLELNTFANAAGGDELSATLVGVRLGLDVTFTKVYDPAAGVHQTPIRYAGAVDPGLSRIEGDWRFDDPNYPRGGFRLERLSGGVVAAKRELVAIGERTPRRRRRSRD